MSNVDTIRKSLEEEVNDEYYDI
jgi:hypothetical protein